MAAIAAMRTTLTRLGFTQDVATMITNVQGADFSIDELKFLNDKGVEGLCNNIHKPDAAAQGEPAIICNPGQGISARAENNLKLCCCFIHHHERISCSVTADQITLADKYSTRLRVLSKMMHLFIGRDNNNNNTNDRAGIQKDMRLQELATEGFTPHQICGTLPLVG